MESSGVGIWVNSIVRKRFFNCTRIILKPPSGEVLKERCEKRDLDFVEVKWFNKRCAFSSRAVTCEEAIVKIREIIKKEKELLDKKGS